MYKLKLHWIRTKALYSCSEALSSLAPKTWELIPNSLIDETSLAVFKSKIKVWATDQYPCHSVKNVYKESDLSKMFQWSKSVLSSTFIHSILYFRYFKLFVNCQIYGIFVCLFRSSGVSGHLLSGLGCFSLWFGARTGANGVRVLRESELCLPGKFVGVRLSALIFVRAVQAHTVERDESRVGCSGTKDRDWLEISE